MPTPNKKVLVIDDEKDLCDVLSEKLTHEGFDTLVAYSGNDGFKCAKTNRPDLILLDVVLPDINGMDLLKKLRGLEWGKSIKIILLTASGYRDKQTRAMELGATGYLIKTDIKIDEVINSVKKELNV